MPDRPPTPSASYRRRLLLIVLVGVVARVVMGLVYNVNHDTGYVRGYQFYLQMARNLVAGDGYHWTFYLGMGEKWANRPPAYPFLLVPALWSGLWPTGAVVLQSLVGGVTVATAGALGRIFRGPGTGLLAAAITALYPYYVVVDTALLENGLLTLAVALTALAFAKSVAEDRAGGAALAGLAAAGGVMARVSFAPVIPLLALSFLPALGLRRGVRFAALLLLFAAAGVAPWLLRNWSAVGAPVLSSDMGRALWVGNNEWTHRIYPEESIDVAEVRAFRHLPREVRREIRARNDDELAQSDFFRGRALDWIREHPGEFAGGALAKLGAFFSPVLNPPTEPPEWKSWVYAMTWGPVLLLGVLGAFVVRRRWRPGLAAVAMLVAFSATAAVFWGESRHRAPLDVLFIVGAAAALTWGFGRDERGVS